MQHLDIPAGGGLDRVEALPCKETQGGGEHAGSGGQGDAGAALAQELRHGGLLGNAGMLASECEKNVERMQTVTKQKDIKITKQSNETEYKN
ncbi:hypothetical protein D3C79_1005420 [compost metagenome]